MRSGAGHSVPTRASTSGRSQRSVDARSSARRFIELAGKFPGGGFQRHVFVRADVKPRDHPFAQGLIRAGGDVYRSIAEYPSPKCGPKHATPMGTFDLDAKDDLSRSQTDALACIESIGERLGVPREHVWVTFSGHKGFHLFVPPSLFGKPAELATTWTWRDLADELKDTVASTIDMAIYRQAGLIRCPNTRNTKSGLFDIPLTVQELETLDVAGIRAMARNPRQYNPWKVPPDSPTARRWLIEQSQGGPAKPTRGDRCVSPERGNRHPGWHTPPCVRAAEHAVIPDGHRHPALESLARFYASVGMAGDEIIQRLREIDARHPIRDPDFIPRMVGYVVQNPRFRSCPSVGLSLYCEPQRCPLKQIGGGDDQH